MRLVTFASDAACHVGGGGVQRYDAAAMDARRSDVLRASPRMFESDLLDRLSRVHPAVPVLIFLPAILVLFILSIGKVSALGIIGLTVAGYVFWTLSEYWIHRSICHFEPGARASCARLHCIIHGRH